MKFIKNKWFWALIVFVVLSVSWSAYTVLAKDKSMDQSPQKSSQKIESTVQGDTKQALASDDPNSKVNSDQGQEPNQDTQNVQGNQDTYDKIMKQIRSIAKNSIVQADANKIYGAQTDVIVDKKQLLVLEGYDTSINKVFYLGKYYLIVDFAIINLSDDDYTSSWSNFTLRDLNGYTYLPSFNYPYLNGDIVGTIKPGESRRGQLAFKITSNEQIFGLDFSTDVKSPNAVHFAIDLTQYFKQFQSNQQAPN